MLNFAGKIKDELLKEWRYILDRPIPLFYDHMPKCGGTTITQILRTQYPRRLTFYTGINVRDSLEHFKSLSRKEQNNYDLIMGHGAFKIRDLLQKRYIKATILRDPVERIISHFYYIKRTPEHRLFQRVHENNIMITDYCDQVKTPEIHNWYCNYYSNLTQAEIKSNSDLAVYQAFQNITSFYDVVGHQSNMVEFMDKLKIVCCLDFSFNNEWHNANDILQSTKPINLEAKERIAEHNQLDIKLYQMLLDNDVEV